MRRNQRRTRLARQRGAVAILVAISTLMLLGFVALGTDIGYVVYSQRRLQAATDAAALAGAVDLWTQSWSTAKTDAQSYAAGQSGATGNGLPGSVTVTTTTITGQQLSSSSSPLPYAKAASGYNGIQVQQQASVPLFFAQVFGVKTVPISATSKAAAGGGSQPAPYNVMIILDTTASMNTTDSNCKINGVTQTRLACAEAGAQSLLQGLTNAGDNVGLMVFPPLSSTYNFSCSKKSPGIAGSYSASGLSYQISPLSTGFLSTSGTSGSSSTTLNTSSSTVQALGGGSCSGMSAPGGLGTFYGDALYAAQAALLTLSNTQSPPGQNAIILLSDGDASSSSKQLGSGSLLAPGSSGSKVTASSIVGSECADAVTVANSIKSSVQSPNTTATLIYTIAYIGGESGANTTQPCSDASSNAKGLDATTPWSPCGTMQSISSGSGYFYSDTCSNAGGTSSLGTIFTQITYSLTKPRLIPLGAT
ncbi:pilus assembly protein TadG-related protein [Paraburkholderia sp. J12]|uniref:pilus assembly protein TadG-related protein n=1 Tax=Paraburkholderia sp. J12 TaxID=2805432 RepID=UPI002ABE7827|nr:pilus assembly protein TadG-related protein [Paraburkholderia sp. J12]